MELEHSRLEDVFSRKKNGDGGKEERCEKGLLKYGVFLKKKQEHRNHSDALPLL